MPKKKTPPSSCSKKTAKKPKMPPGRTASGKVPEGRTLSTCDHYLPGEYTGSRKKRNVVVIEANDRNELAVVPLSGSSGRNRSEVKHRNGSKSYFKHFVEIQDNDGFPIKVNEKFRENHPKEDISRKGVLKIIDTVFGHSLPAGENRKKMKKFRGK